MSREEYWVIQDGLRVGFGQRDVSENSGKKIVTEGAVEQIILDINDATGLAASVVTSDDAVVEGAHIPANSLILSAKLIVKSGGAFTSGGAPTLDVGTYDLDGAAVDEDGLIAAEVLANLDADGDVVDGAGAQVGTVVTQDVRVAARANVATYTAGAAQVVVEYIPQV